MKDLSSVQRSVPTVIAGLFIMLWIYAATSKLLDYQTFQVQLGQSPLLTPISSFVAWCIPLTEIGIAVLLFTERFRLWGLYLSFALMSLFTVYIFAVTRFSDDVPCSCGGILEKMSWGEHLVFNVIFMMLAALGVVLQTKDIVLQQVRTSRKPV